MLVNKHNIFKCFVGIDSLEQIAAKDDRILVMNILGNESRKVTPVSHVYSGGNIVAGVQYGRSGKMKTPIGDIPVYSRLAEAIQHHDFNVGVVYLPPAAVYHAVAELIHYNKKLKKIVIVTEKLSVKDQLSIRAIAQTHSISVFGANSLGVADTWNHVRIGGGLGGDKPEELLIKGSVAIHSNSGNFSTTITEYLKTQGFGTTTLVSSGKDNIIQYPIAEFLYAAQNDSRTKGVVVYIEPGGFYEKVALDLITSGKLKFNKPVIACITGHWKSKLSRAVGHAGALAGSKDDAESKEKWFNDYFGIKNFNPDKPGLVSNKGVTVNSIQNIPLAVKAVFDKLNMKPDFAPIGNLSLKAWFGNDMNWKLPKNLQLPIVKAITPYNLEIETANRQLGAVYLRRNMRNTSAVSYMNPQTHITELHGKTVTELSKNSYEENIVFALGKSLPEVGEIDLINASLNYLAKVPQQYFDLILSAEKNHATPNQALISVLAVMGDTAEMQNAGKLIRQFTQLYTNLNIRNLKDDITWEEHIESIDEIFGLSQSKYNSTSIFDDLIRTHQSNIFELAKFIIKNYTINDPDEFIVTSILFHLFFTALVKKKITKNTLENIYTYLSILAKLTILSATDLKKNTYINDLINSNEVNTVSFTKTAFYAVFNYEPDKLSLNEFATLLGITLTNGPGTLSAKGAKESVSAGNNISTAYIGYLSNTGLVHGGNGFKGIEFLLDSFQQKNTNPNLTIEEIAQKAASGFAEQKRTAKLSGKAYAKIPGINHPVFKGEKENIDPREAYIYKYFKQQNINNDFWDFYKLLVKELYKKKITKNIYAVNIDAVIAVISLKLLWKMYLSGKISEKEIQKIGFSIFLLGRNVGVTSEIIDHKNRGTDMDCRTPMSETRFVV